MTKLTAGFTLIELIIAIAIGGLIIVLVFVGLGQAQRTNRDAQRKADAARYLEAARQFANDTSGINPTCDISVDPGAVPCDGVAPGINTNYLTKDGASFDDPSTPGTHYNVVVGSAPGAYALGTMYVSPGAICKADGVMVIPLLPRASQRKFAVAVALESTNSYYCVSY